MKATPPLTDPEVREIIAVLAGHLRELRQARGLSLRALARETGIPFSSLSRIERDVSVPEGEALVRLAHWLREQAKRRPGAEGVAP